MALKLDRVHVVLGLLLALGIGFRAIDSADPGVVGAPSAGLQAQRARIARTPDRRSGTAPATRTPPKVARGRGDSTRTLRVERTPVGAVAPGANQGAPDPRAPTPVNLDRAGAREIEGLPGIGPTLAQRIVEDRERRGPFGSLAELQRVKGVGERLAARLALLVTFESTGRPSNVIVPPGPGAPSSRRLSRRQQPVLVPPGA